MEWFVGGRCVGLVVVIDEPILGVLVTDVEVHLDRVLFCDDGLRHVAVFQFERGFVLGEVFVGLRATCFDDGDAESCFGKALRGPAAGCTGADYENVKMSGGIGSGHLRGCRDQRGSDAVFYERDASKRGWWRQREKVGFRRAKVLLDGCSEWYHRRRICAVFERSRD